jgi:hypothetical protein
MGEAYFLNRPFKPLVERPHKGEILRAAPRSLFFLISKLVDRPRRGEVLLSRSTLTSFGAGMLILNGMKGLKTP